MTTITNNIKIKKIDFTESNKAQTHNSQGKESHFSQFILKRHIENSPHGFLSFLGQALIFSIHTSPSFTIHGFRFLPHPW